MPTLNHMTLSELNFALKVEQLLHSIEHPEYIQIVIELLCVVATILQRNPELTFRGSLDVDKMVESAYKMFQKVRTSIHTYVMWGRSREVRVLMMCRYLII